MASLIIEVDDEKPRTPEQRAPEQAAPERRRSLRSRWLLPLLGGYLALSFVRFAVACGPMMLRHGDIAFILPDFVHSTVCHPVRGFWGNVHFLLGDEMRCQQVVIKHGFCAE